VFTPAAQARCFVKCHSSILNFKTIVYNQCFEPRLNAARGQKVFGATPALAEADKTFLDFLILFYQEKRMYYNNSSSNIFYKINRYQL
jgi:hypothetical protein